MHSIWGISPSILEQYYPRLFPKDDNIDKSKPLLSTNTGAYIPVYGEEVLKTLQDTSIRVPVAIGNVSESEVEELLKKLITGVRLGKLRVLLEDYGSNCGCTPGEYVCLGHQLSWLFDIDNPEPTEFKTYNSLYDLMPKVPWKKGGFRVLSDK